MYFRQIFDPVSSSLCYLVADPESLEAAVIDPQPAQALLVLSILQEQSFVLRYVLRTHVHQQAPHDCGLLCHRAGVRYGVGAQAYAPEADLRLEGGDSLPLGGDSISVLSTPGHTPGCISFLWKDRIFVGDLMTINGCGEAVVETDFGAMYDSVTRKIMALPDETLLFPAHDFRGRTVSTVAEERRMNNAFLGRNRESFVNAMSQAPHRPRHHPQAA